MPLVTETQVRSAAGRARAALNESSTVVLKKSMASVSSVSRFDIFLSHSINDAEIVLGAKRLLEESGKVVYVDWIEDPNMDRSNVTPATAGLLRTRMKQSDALFYLHSAQSLNSKWMPWELGFFDGYNGNVAIFPVITSAATSYRGVEYLGLYPYVDLSQLQGSNRQEPFIHRKFDEYQSFGAWKSATDKLRPRVDQR